MLKEIGVTGQPANANGQCPMQKPRHKKLLSLFSQDNVCNESHGLQPCLWHGWLHAHAQPQNHPVNPALKLTLKKQLAGAVHKRPAKTRQQKAVAEEEQEEAEEEQGVEEEADKEEKEAEEEEEEAQEEEEEAEEGRRARQRRRRETRRLRTGRRARERRMRREKRRERRRLKSRPLPGKHASQGQ